MKSRDVIAFRPKLDEQNKKRLELAERLGININEVMRDALPDLLDKKIKKRAAEMRVVLEEVPA